MSEAREHIMETALSLFYSRGCKAITMDDIASAAGISKRTLYEHFGDKEALLEAGIRWWEVENGHKIETILKESENMMDMLLKIHYFQAEQMVNMSIDLVSDIKKYYPQVFKNTVLASREKHQERTRTFFQRGQAEGIFRTDINIDLINELFELLFYFIHDNNMALVRKYSYQEFFRCTTICFIRGIATEKGRKYLDEHYM